MWWRAGAVVVMGREVSSRCVTSARGWLVEPVIEMGRRRGEKENKHHFGMHLVRDACENSRFILMVVCRALRPEGRAPHLAYCFDWPS